MFIYKHDSKVTSRVSKSKNCDIIQVLQKHLFKSI